MGGLLGAIFGSGKKTSTTTSTTENADKRLVTGEGSAGVSGDGNTVSVVTNVTDGGALDFAAAVANGAASAVSNIVGDALTVTNNSVSTAIESMLESQRASTSAQITALQDSLAASASATAAAISSGRETTRDVIDLADRSQGRLVDSFADSIGLTKHIVDQALGYTGDSIAQIAKSYETSRDQDQEKTTKDYRYLLVAALAIIGIVAFKAVR